VGLKGLDRIFSPKTVAVIGASNREGSVGHSLMANLLGHGFKGTVYPINPKRDSVQGVHAYAKISDVPRQVDLAVIATPAKTVPKIVEECGKAGVRGLVVISAGFKETGAEGRKLENQIAKTIKKYKIRLIGPNCLGVINPRHKLNASFATTIPKPGNIAFISQSGAICSSIIDWANKIGIGFSYFVSVGSMLDADFGDLIDYFGRDPKTKSVVIYMESIKNAKKFMSAASGLSQNKPIIIAKSGRFDEGRKAVVSHTGVIAGLDEVYSAAFRRAGVVRVFEVADLFDTSEKLAMGLLPKGPGIVVVTNAGGPGVMATDKIVELGGGLAKLSRDTIEELNKKLPANWSGGNPVDVLGDAGPKEYKAAVAAARKDGNVDNIVVILTPQAGCDPKEVAQAVVDAWSGSGKPITACWMGGKTVEGAIEVLRKNNIPSYPTPEAAVKPLLFGYEYIRNLELLHETPEEISEGLNPDRVKLKKIIDEHKESGQLILSERDSKEFLKEYNIPTTPMALAKTKREAIAAAEKIGYPVVMKIESPDVTHKTDVGGVVLSILSKSEVEDSYNWIKKSVRKHNPKARVTGITVSKMIESRGFEVLLGALRDEVFGEVIVFGAGGTLVEVMGDKGIGLPPLNQTLAIRLMEETRTYRLLKEGGRDRSPANLRELEKAIVNFSQMLVENPEITEVDINPLLATRDSIVALDARIVLTKKRVSDPKSHLCITPYPRELSEEWTNASGGRYLLRPIKAEDEHRLRDLFQSLSPKTIRYRFFHPLTEVTHEMLIRYCHNDYDREIAIVAEKDGKILGVSRLMFDPGEDTAEFAVVVTDKSQNKGLGTKLVSRIVEIAREKGLTKVYATVIKENFAMTHVAKKLGFVVEEGEDEGINNLTYYIKQK